jgi:peptide/nickel transport system substrate-binding protein/microcin C transport system substrate-binding protein
VKILDEGKFDAVNLGWGGGSVDVDPKQIWHSSSAVKGGSNFIAYSNPEVDALIDQARGTLEKQKRIPLLKKAFARIAEDVPYLFLFNDAYALYAHTARVKKPVETYRYSIGTAYWWAEGR